MKAVLLAGGFATRLGEIARNTPKCLLKVGDRTILDYVLEKLEGMGVSDPVIISINKRFEDNFNQWREQSPEKARIRFVVEPACKEEEKLGCIGALKFVFGEERLHDDVVIVGADNLFDFDIAPALQLFRARRLPVVVLYDIKSTEEAKKFGVAAVGKDGRITSFVEKPEKPLSTLISTAVYFFPKDFIGKINEYIAAGNSPDKMGYFVRWMAERYSVLGYIANGAWYDIGTPDIYNKVKDGI